MARQGKYTKRPSKLKRSGKHIQRRWKWFRNLSTKQKIAVIAVPIIVLLIIIPLITYAIFARDIDNPERLMNRNNTGVELLDKNGQVFYSSGNSAPLTRLPLNQISDFVEKSAVSSEDKNFYEHSGVSVKGLLSAIYANFANRDATAYGGSTITQQLVKNTLLSSNKNFLRKYQELSLAIAVDRHYSKDDILDMYLNSVYYGEGAFGIDQAAKTYFNKSANDLTLAESAMLIGILPAPSAYSPISGDPAKAKTQQERVLRRLVEDKKITQADADAASAVQLAYAPAAQAKVSVAPHFAEIVTAELNKKYGEETVARSGYRVTTTLDLNWQKQAEKIVADQTVINAPRGGRNAALVAIDPKNGEIRALVGSANYNDPTFGQVNMAITPRQPGSSFKPIYYTEALNERLVTPATIEHDKPTTYGSYAPQNFDFKFRGDISLRNALSQSLNIPSVNLMQELSVQKALDTAKRMGITTLTRSASDYGLPLALGAGETTPLEMTNAYAAFANAGEQYQATSIQTIKSKFDDTIYTYSPVAKRVQTAQASFLISDILSDNTARAPTFGSTLNIPGRKVAVKTGSTDNNHDAWTIGYTPSLVIGVWVGNNENQAMQSGGSAFAGPIWRKSMQAFLGSSSAESFAQPSGISQVSICKSNGLRATNSSTPGTYNEFFISGTVPTESCSTTQSQPRNNTDTQTDDNTSDPTPTTPAQVDTDQDGVIDSKDKCPSTPAGVAVDSTGCPVVVTPTADTDKDGVPDANDSCPNTPAGTPVDAKGCPIVNGQQGVILGRRVTYA